MVTRLGADVFHTDLSCLIRLVWDPVSYSLPDSEADRGVIDRLRRYIQPIRLGSPER